METRANYVTIGLFTLAVIAAGFAFVYWLARYDELGGRRALDVVIPGTVNGLAPGGLVTFNGIKIGEVIGMHIDPADPTKVIVSTAVETKAPIKIDTRATLGGNMLTGVAYIELSGGSAGAADLTAPEGQTPTLTAANTGIADVISGLQSTVSKLDASVTKVNAFLDKAEPSINESLENVRVFTGALKTNSPGIRDLMANMAKLSDSVGRVSGKVEGLVDHADQVVMAVDPAKVRSVVSDAQQMTQRLNAASMRVDTILGKAENMLTNEDGSNFFQEATKAAASIRRVSETFEARSGDIAGGLARFSTRGLDDLTSLIADARRTIARFDRIGSGLERNPQQLIFGGTPAVREYNRR